MGRKIGRKKKKKNKNEKNFAPVAAPVSYFRDEVVNDDILDQGQFY